MLENEYDDTAKYSADGNHISKKKYKTSWGWAEPSSAKAWAMDSVEIRLKIDV